MMENNTLLSQELEEMRTQIALLKDKLCKQEIVNKDHIRNSMKNNMSNINKTVTATIFLGIFGLVYSTWFFLYQGCSIEFTVASAIMLAVCLALTILQRIKLGSIDFTQGNLIETAEKLSKIKKHYQNWHWKAIPMILVWFGWMVYEMIGILGTESPIAIGFICGAAAGLILGGIAGLCINRKIIRKSNEILKQIEELLQQ